MIIQVAVTQNEFKKIKKMICNTVFKQTYQLNQ